MRIPDGVLPPEVANDPRVVCRKAGLTEFHARVLVALEQLAGYYQRLEDFTTERPVKRQGAKDA